MKKKSWYLVVGIILLVFGLYSSGYFFSLIGYQKGYTTIKMTATNGDSVIWSGTFSAPITYNGKTYTANVRSTPLNSGYAAIAWYENGVQVDGTWNIPAPDCPSCTPAYYYPPGNTPVGYVVLRPDLYGGADCYTNKNANDQRGPIGSTFCYLDIAFANPGTVTTCTDNGITYNAGDQIKRYNCYSTFNGKTCASNYYYVQCASGQWSTASVCYAGADCGSIPSTCTTPCPTGKLQRPYPDCSCYDAPTPSCTPGQTVPCKTEKGCDGTSTCYYSDILNRGEWGACMKTDMNCDNWMIPQWVYYLLIGIGVIIIIWAVIKK